MHQGVTIGQIAAELGIVDNMSGRWRGELRRQPDQTSIGQGRSRYEEVSQLRRELAPGHEGAGIFCGKRQRSSRERRMKFRMTNDAATRFPSDSCVAACASRPVGIYGGRHGDSVRVPRRLRGSWRMTGWWNVHASGKNSGTQANGVSPPRGAVHAAGRLA
jgi:hypothetical protein